MSQSRRILYLHGFASSPNSRKARFFGDRLAEEGCSMEALDLAQGDFRSLTLSRQLTVIAAAAKEEPLILIGSSMGGYLAALYAARHPEVERILLLAPAFEFADLWTRELGPDQMEAWRINGTMHVFHYGEGSQMSLGFDLMDDAQKYEAYPAISQPCLIFHGTQDAVVPIEVAEKFTLGSPNTRLVRLESGHELTDTLNEIWKESKPFLLNRTYNKMDSPVSGSRKVR